MLTFQKYQDNLEHVKGDLMKADKVFRDIIDKGYLSDNEGFRDQVYLVGLQNIQKMLTNTNKNDMLGS